ncbi:hypothetical protein [Rhodopirellula baltica]|uniref:Sulfotransferase family protein n=1 Tax=Rhodopirellula baltica SWK14 TaxID=993516 RepID=L7C892_RHOBT|nr:hypothetical protein [Rhodopirellula baltica]ELP30258.1 hypothetical protein RBSWK_05856 [Rhodopirellula baltica SWK14]
MIISHRHKFIFIATQCTGSERIERALASVCGADDVIAAPPLQVRDPASHQDWELARNYEWKDVPFKAFCELINQITDPRVLAEAGKLYAKSKSFAATRHLGASCARRLVHPQVWKGYYKFCVEREPTGKIRSMYQSLPAEAKPASIDSWIETGRHSILSDFGLYSNQGRMLVDQVYAAESAEQWWPELCQKLGLGEQVRLPDLALNAGHLAELRLSPLSVRQIAIDFAREIQLFGYRPPPDIASA